MFFNCVAWIILLPVFFLIKKFFIFFFVYTQSFSGIIIQRDINWFWLVLLCVFYQFIYYLISRRYSCVYFNLFFYRFIKAIYSCASVFLKLFLHCLFIFFLLFYNIT